MGILQNGEGVLETACNTCCCVCILWDMSRGHSKFVTPEIKVMNAKPCVLGF